MRAWGLKELDDGRAAHGKESLKQVTFEGGKVGALGDGLANEAIKVFGHGDEGIGLAKG